MNHVGGVWVVIVCCIEVYKQLSGSLHNKSLYWKPVSQRSMVSCPCPLKPEMNIKWCDYKTRIRKRDIYVEYIIATGRMEYVYSI